MPSTSPSVRLGEHILPNRLILAPMAGVTDQAFRQICTQLGAAMTVAEMITSDSRLWESRKSSLRMISRHESEPRAVQLLGNNPEIMAQAAKAQVDLGAQVIDINMGCPAKKYANKRQALPYYKMKNWWAIF